MRFMVFDVVVDMGEDVRRCDLVQRVKWAGQFIEKYGVEEEEYHNQEVGQPVIEIVLKDFFEIDNPYINQFEMFFSTHVKSLNHKNDGIIFNKKWEAPYGQK